MYAVLDRLFVFFLHKHICIKYVEIKKLLYINYHFNSFYKKFKYTKNYKMISYTCRCAYNICNFFSVGRWADKLGSELWELANEVARPEELLEVSIFTRDNKYRMINIQGIISRDMTYSFRFLLHHFYTIINSSLTLLPIVLN